MARVAHRTQFRTADQQQQDCNTLKHYSVFLFRLNLHLWFVKFLQTKIFINFYAPTSGMVSKKLLLPDLIDREQLFLFSSMFEKKLTVRSG